MKGVLDGALLWRFVSLPIKEQVSITTQRYTIQQVPCNSLSAYNVATLHTKYPVIAYQHSSDQHKLDHHELYQHKFDEHAHYQHTLTTSICSLLNKQ